MAEKKTKALVKVDSNLPVAQWDAEKWERIKKMYLPTCKNDVDVEIFMELAKAYDLSPFKREIWAITYNKWNKEKKQKEPVTQIFCGRDGFLSIAHKSGMFNGLDTEFGYGKQGELLWARTTVWNKSCEHPIKCKVFLREYSSGENLWKTKPHVMLQKVAESTALRRAFNISGLYSPEEFKEEVKEASPQVNNPPSSTPASLPAPENITPQTEEAPQKGNFNGAIKTIEGCWDMAKILRFEIALKQRAWSPDENQFLKDATEKQKDKIIFAQKEGE